MLYYYCIDFNTHHLLTVFILNDFLIFLECHILCIYYLFMTDLHNCISVNCVYILWIVTIRDLWLYKSFNSSWTKIFVRKTFQKLRGWPMRAFMVFKSRSRRVYWLHRNPLFPEIHKTVPHCEISGIFAPISFRIDITTLFGLLYFCCCCCKIIPHLTCYTRLLRYLLLISSLNL